MANTYTKLYIHFIFVVQSRMCLINSKWCDLLYGYMCGIVEQQGHKLYIANGTPDHVHALVSMNPKQSPSELMYYLKRGSSLWINENKFTKLRFSWQEGFGAFSVGKEHLDQKYKYIENQKRHHAIISFREEYLDFLKEYEISYDEQYIFKDVI